MCRPSTSIANESHGDAQALSGLRLCRLGRYHPPFCRQGECDPTLRYNTTVCRLHLHETTCNVTQIWRSVSKSMCYRNAGDILSGVMELNREVKAVGSGFSKATSQLE